MDYKPTSQGTEFNTSLNRHTKCTLKSNRMSIHFQNHRTSYFKDFWVLVRNSWSVFWMLSLFALQQGGFWVPLWTYCKLKISSLFRFYKYFTNGFNTKYLLVNNLHLSDNLVSSCLLLSPVESQNQNKFVKFSDFSKKNQFVWQSLVQVTHNQVVNNSLMFGVYQSWAIHAELFRVNKC